MHSIPRKSRMELDEVYFWTDTIKDWKHLLRRDKHKRIIIEQLQWLIERNKITVYGYVIMPNHLHLLWKMREKNGREMPYASFNKWTSSQFLKDLRRCHPRVLPYFIEETTERKHRFWQRDALAIRMDSRRSIAQTLTYIHNNPLQEHWSLVTAPEDYRWSSARFYLTGDDEFGILTHYRDEF